MTRHSRQSGALQRCLVAAAAFSARHPAASAAAALVLCAACALYAVRHFAIDTDSSKLISEHVAWRQREIGFDAAFAQRTDLIAVVVDAATPELAERAATLLSARLTARKDLFRSVRRPDGGPFFARNGLLFLDRAEVAKTTEQLVAAQPLLGVLAADPSVRGLMSSLQLATAGIEHGETTLATLQPSLRALALTLDGVAAGKPTPLPWQNLLGGGAADPRALRRFVLAQPRLDFTQLQPGEAASGFIRASARELGLEPARGVRVRLTGEVPMADEELSTLGENAGRNAFVMLLALLGMLWLALRSLRAVAAIVVCLVVGLAVTAAFGLAVFGVFNLLSVAFAVLFVGLGVDFAIQYGVAYRAVGGGNGADDDGAAVEASREQRPRRSDGTRAAAAAAQVGT
ncbi:MAG: MMPL family transporter, partial [Pseudomonadota bacterium]|nr:MMPL family transporter [Pseudomonadota bacterium]